MIQDFVDKNQHLTNQIYDIYVVKTSGIPLFAGCTATDYCQMHMAQHELISGFFSAMFSFSEESFNDDILETMVYGNILLNFLKDDENDLIFAFIHDRASDNKFIRNHLIEAHKIFINEYSDYLEEFLVDQAKFANYRDILKKRGIISDKLIDTSGMVKTFNDDHKESKSSIVSWIKGFFN